MWLTPIYGGLGVAYSFLIGTIIGFAATIIIANRIAFHIGWRDVAVAVSIPSLTGLLAHTLELYWLLGSAIILMLSIFGYTRLGLVERRDLQELSKAILPQTVVQHVYPRLRWLFGLLYGD